MLKILTAFRIEKKKNRFKSTSIDHLYESNEVFFFEWQRSVWSPI